MTKMIKSHRLLMKHLSLLLSTLFLVGYSSIFVKAQSNLGIGDWEVHLPYKLGKALAMGDDEVYYASSIGLITINKQTLERNFFSKVDGLHDVRIGALGYDASSQALLLAYDNTKLDVVTQDGIFLINDIFDKSILGDKTIYRVTMDGNGKAYLSTGFGLVGFDMESRLFDFFTSTEFKVNDFVIDGEVWYMATETGLYSFDSNTSADPSDLGQWRVYGSDSGLTENQEVVDVFVEADGALMVTAGDIIYRKPQGTEEFSTVAQLPAGASPEFLFEYNAMMHISVEEEDRSKFYEIDGADLIPLDLGCTDKSQDAIQDENGILWLADEYENIRYVRNGECKLFYGVGPRSTNMSDLYFEDDTLYVAPGGVADNFTYKFDKNGFYTYADKNWKNYHQFNTPIIADSNLINMYTIHKHPITGKTLVGTFWNGLLEIDLTSKEGTLFNKHANSPLQGAIGDEARTRIGGLAVDRDDNVWVCNFASPRALQVWTPEGVWHAYDTGSVTWLTDIVVDDIGYKWAVVGGVSGGVLVYDDNQTLADPTDDRQYFINASNSLLESNIIHSIVKDLNGDIWVGSDSGPVIFRCGDEIFDGECSGNTRIVTQDGIPAILLQTESIRAINVDGGNRKWIGTTNGVYVQSPDGFDQIEHYTTENSPLLDNVIIDFAFDGKQGLMYIATNSGLNVIRTEATSARATHEGKVVVYPNPVRPDYVGPIAIKGLAQDAEVKITDVNGLLVYETTAIGGQAIWDGNDYNGRRASTGVYLVFSSSTDNFRDPDTAVSKIMLVR